MLMLCAVVSACGVPLGGKTASRLQGVIVDQQLNEISGLTASGRHANVFWVIDDGGNAAQLYAINRYGTRVATYTIDGVNKTDWEDIDQYTINGRHYLVIADTGDNGALRKTLQLHVIEEPAALSNSRLQPTRSIAFRFPDGPHDTEAMTVDIASRQVLLITKKRKPPILFSVSLDPDAPKVQTAKRLGDVIGVPSASKADLKARPRLAPYDHQVTAASISPNGNTMAVLTYRYVLLYTRKGKEKWSRAVSRDPLVRVLPVIPQAEAMGYTADGQSVFVTGEFSVAPLYRIPVPQ